ncbi:MAG: PBP1A family penicillin-binding protein [Sphingomonadales bacterium]
MGWAASLFAASLVFAVLAVALLARDLPDVNQVRPVEPATAMEILASDGSLLARYGKLRGDWLRFEEIPPVMIDAILAIEDRRFFNHPGFDWRGIARAVVANLGADRVRQGGSTITQQLAKNLFLSNERTLERKAKELLLALQLEARYSKQELLELYLNRVYLGAGTYGIDAAARVYFGHGARRLQLAEAAVLAGLVKAPSRLAPTNDPDAANARARLVIAAMQDAGYLSPAQAADAAARPVRFAIAGDDWGARYFTDWVAARARAKLGAETRPVRVFTSLNPAWQAAAEAAVGSVLDEAGQARAASQAALVALAPDGAVRAMVGGRDYRRSMFNRAVQARRQPGSAFKPFVYLTAFEAGFTPRSLMRDSPVVFDKWAPANFTGDYQGLVTLEQAFAQSINTVAVKLSETVDRHRVIAMARRLGISTPITPHPSVALGTAEVTPLELASAYAVIANGGYAAAPYAITAIRAGDGSLLYQRPADPLRRIVGGREAAMMTDLLAANIARGTGKAARPDRPAAGKTGTSQDYRDAWFMGFTADMVAGVWVGNDDNSAMLGVTGGGLPARIWANFVRRASDGLAPRPLAGSRFAQAAHQDRAGAQVSEKRLKPSLWQRLFGRW